MASLYPGALDAPTDTHADNVNEAIHAADVNLLADGLLAVETTLGINPQGTSTDVVTRLNATDSEFGTNPSGVYTDVATRLNTLETVVFNTQTGTTYTLLLADATRYVVCTNVTACTVTIPTNASVAFSTGTQIMIRAGTGSGTITISPAGGVTLANPYNSFALVGPNAQALLLKIGTNAWSLNGEVA